MRNINKYLVCFLPLMVALGLPDGVKAQSRGWGAGIGVGVGPGYGYGPYWGPGWGPGWGIYPSHFPGFYGNGLSMYGPPVPTHRPIPGVFGGGDSQFFGLPPLYRPGFYNYAYIPISGPGRLPDSVQVGPVSGPIDVLAIDPEAKAGPLEVEVRLPREDAKLFVDGVAFEGTGRVRRFATPELAAGRQVTYEIRAEWPVDGLGTTHTKRVTGKASEKVVVEIR